MSICNVASAGFLATVAFTGGAEAVGREVEMFDPGSALLTGTFSFLDTLSSLPSGVSSLLILLTIPSPVSIGPLNFGLWPCVFQKATATIAAAANRPKTRIALENLSRLV